MADSDDLIRGEQELADKLGAFSEMLNDIPSLDTKLRVIWEEVYQNAVKDRAAANMQMLSLISGANLAGSGTSYALELETAPAIVKYLERMAKSTDQLLDLARRIEDHMGSDDEFDEDELYNSIHADD